jgi:predicted ABC-type ATPase
MVDLRQDLALPDMRPAAGRTTSNWEGVVASFWNTPTTVSGIRRDNELAAPVMGRLITSPDGPDMMYRDETGAEVTFSPNMQQRMFDDDISLDLMRDLWSEIEAGGAAPPMPFEAYQEQYNAILERRRSEFEANERIIAASENPFRNRLIGGVAGGFADPVNLATIPLAAPVRLGAMGTVAFEAALNASIEGLSTPARNEYLRSIGQEEEDILVNMLVGATFGGVVAGGLQLGGATARATGRALDVRNPARALGREMDAILDQLDPAAADLAREAFMAGSRGLQDPRARMEVAEALTNSEDPEIAAFAESVLRDAEDEATATTDLSPAARTEHLQRAQEAFEALESGGEITMPDRPARAVPRGSLLGGNLEEFDPRELVVDPERFQFKSEGTGPEGLTDKLTEVTEWQPRAAGTIIVFEDINGVRFVADGHQRSGLARRLMESDPSQDIKLAGFVMRERDGWTAEQVRMEAALVNIMQAADGMTQAMARDAARVLRVSAEAIERLPRGPGIARAQALAKLGDDAFSLVINDVVPDRFAALVGNLTSDPRLQMAYMRLLERTGPSSEAQARSILEQAQRSPLTEEVTEDLFGTEVIAESLYVERAKVLERAMQLMRDDQRTFRTLTDRASTISEAGNELNEITNKQMREMMDTALGAVDKLAYRAGPISEALDDGARQYKETGRLKDAARAVTDAIRAEIERNGLAGAEASPRVGAAEPTGSGTRASDPNEGFDDPIDGAGAKDQIRATRIDANERPEEGFNSDEEARRDLGQRVSAGATRDEIDTHPAVVKAIEDMLARRESATNLDEAYGSPQWHEAREYVFPAEQIEGTDFEEVVITGTDAAMDAWKARAEAFAGPEGAGRNRRIKFLLGPPAAGKSTIAEALAAQQRFAIVDSDEIKKTLPEFEGGIGAAAVHSESSDLSKAMFADMLDEGTDIIFPKVGDDVKSIRKVMDQARAAGYTVELVNMAVTSDNAYNRMIGRFVTKGRLIPPDYFDTIGEKPSATYNALKGEADGYANIDNNTGFGEPSPVLERSERNNPLEGSDLDIYESDAGGGRPGDGRAGRDLEAPEGTAPEGSGPVIEETPAGSQMLMDGVDPITTRDRVQAAADKPLLAPTRTTDTEIGGLFDASDPARYDLFDQVPVGVEQVDGETVVRTVSRKDLADELDADDLFAQQVGICMT